MSPMKTNADKDLKQQHSFWKGGVVGKTWRKYKTKQKKKKSARLHKTTHFLRMFYILQRRKQYNRINFGELSSSK